jgi:hypothetical protein
MALTRFPTTFANQAGSQLCGAFVNTFLYGAALLLALQYFKRHAKADALYVKLTIGAMVLLATLETICINFEMYRNLISKHGAVVTGQPAPIEWTLPTKFICVFLITFIAQIFFASRIWVLTQNVGRSARFAIIPIVALAIMQLAAGSVIVNIEATSGTFAELSKHAKTNKAGTAIQGAATAAADIAITVTLCYLYHMHRSVSARVNSIVDRLVIYAINRAAATSICAILSVIFFFMLQGTYYFIIPTLMTGQLYLISAVSILTSRESLRDDTDATMKDTQNDDGSVTKHDGKGYNSSEKSV